MPMYPFATNLKWASTVESTVNGSGGANVVQAYTTAGAFDTIYANQLQDNDRVRLYAEFECTRDAAANVVPNIYWGGVATGYALFNTAYVLASATGLVIKLQAELTFRTTGGSPVWGHFSEWMCTGNTTYEDMKKAYGQTTQPTNANILVQASSLFSGGCTVNDVIRLRTFRREILRY